MVNDVEVFDDRIGKAFERVRAADARNRLSLSLALPHSPHRPQPDTDVVLHTPTALEVFA